MSEDVKKPLQDNKDIIPFVIKVTGLQIFNLPADNLMSTKNLR